MVDSSPAAVAAMVRALHWMADGHSPIEFDERDRACLGAAALLSRVATERDEARARLGKLDIGCAIDECQYDAAARQLAEARAEIERLRAGLAKVRAYNVDIAAGRISYRPHDHIEALDRALFFGETQNG